MHDSEKKQTVILCFAAFLAACLGGLIAASVNGIYPFGNNSVLISDLSCEYLPFLTELWDKIHSGGSIIYSWKTGLGGNFTGNFLYYLSSPFNLLIMLFPRAQIQNAISLFILIRQGLSSAFMTYFFCRRKNGEPGVFALACGIPYAFCGWFSAFYYSIIWLDVFMLMPLLLLGVERIIDENRCILFATVLCVMLFSSFYMAYIAGVSSVIYWFWYYLSEYSFKEYGGTGKNRKKIPFFKSRFFFAGHCFAVTSFLCICIMSAVLLPLFFQMSKNYPNSDIPSKAVLTGHTALRMSKYLSGSVGIRDLLVADEPNVYTGLSAFLLFPLYFFAEKNSKKKLLSFFVCAFIVLSFCFKFLDYFWHGFRYPNGFAFRESFFLSFMLLICAFETLKNIKNLPKFSWIFPAGVFCAFAVGAAISISKDADQALISGTDILVSTAISAVLYVLLFTVYRRNDKRLVFSFCLLIVFAELFDGAYSFARNTDAVKTEYSEYVSIYNSMSELTSLTEEGFYRSELPVTWTIDDGAYFNYNGVRQSSSMTRYETYNFLGLMGMDTNYSNFTEYYPQTPVLNSILGVKYFYELKDWVEYSSSSLASCRSLGINPVASDENFNMYKSDCGLPLGFESGSALAEWCPEMKDAVKNQNEFYKLLSDTEKDILCVCPGTIYDFPVQGALVEQTGDYHFDFSVPEVEGQEFVPLLTMEITAQADGAVYLYADMSSKIYPYVYIVYEKPDGSTGETVTSGFTYMSSVFDAKAGEKIKAYIITRAGAAGSVSACAFQIDDRAFENAFKKTDRGFQWNITDFSDTHISGTAEVEKNRSFMQTTIPFDEGWKILVDGTEYPPENIIKTGGCLIGIFLDKGNHTVTFEYSLKGFVPGIIISLAGITVSSFIAVIRRKKKHEKKQTF